MSELTLLLLRVGFLVLLWGFVFIVVYSMRADLFGQRVRKLPAAPKAAVPVASAPAAGTIPQVTKPSEQKAKKNKPTKAGVPATTESVSRIVVVSGPKAGLELPLGTESLTIGRSSESGLVIRDDYTSSHHARLMLWGEQWMVQDLDSTNGTKHNGSPVTAPTPVSVDTPITVGATTFELRK